MLRPPLLLPLLGLFTVAHLAPACGAHSALEAQMAPLPLADLAPAPLERDVFKRDVMGQLSEEDLRAVLRAPVFLEEHARIGIVPVATGYAVDADLPLAGPPGVLAAALEESGHFEIVSEVSTDWPCGESVAGLRELAARYRADYLLLYRHRFVERTYTNAWAVGWLTVVGALFLPHTTLETAGVVEATLFDVKSGTLLFTVFDRVAAKGDLNAWQRGPKRRAVKERLLDKAARGLSERVLDKVRLLVAARPAPSDPTPATALGSPTTPRPEGAARISASSTDHTP